MFDEDLTQAYRLKITFDSYNERAKSIIARIKNLMMLYSGTSGVEIDDYLRGLLESAMNFQGEIESVLHEIDANISEGFTVLVGANEDVCENDLAKLETLLFNYERYAKNLGDPPLAEGTYKIGDPVTFDEDEDFSLGPLN